MSVTSEYNGNLPLTANREVSYDPDEVTVCFGVT